MMHIYCNQPVISNIFLIESLITCIEDYQYIFDEPIPMTLPQQPVVPSQIDLYDTSSPESTPLRQLTNMKGYLPEFCQYSKEIYEKKRSKETVTQIQSRRRVHIQSEQRRRAQIKDGFDALRQHLPGCAGKKISKVSLLSYTVQHLQHFKKSQNRIKIELERLIQDNEKLKAQLYN